jgi:lipopolysaccharide biosynthesis protein
VQAVGAEARIMEEVRAILASGKFRGDFFKPREMESSPEEKLVENYVRRMATGFGLRKPMPGFQPTVYSWLHSREGKTNGDPFADFLRNGLPDGPWLQSVIQSGGTSKIPPHAGLRAAIHLHVSYPDQLAGIAERLKLNASAPDLFISATSQHAAAQTREVLSGYRGRIVDVEVTPNLGRDIGPLLTQFGRTLSASYDVIGHLHTKKSVLLENPSFAEAWNTFLLENLVGGKRSGPMLDLILASMASDPAIGIVFPDDPHVLSWTGNRNHADALAARMKCEELPEQFNFPIGAMFWTRSAVLKRFLELGLVWGDYEPEPLPVDGMMAHAIERLFGVVPGVMGMTCAVTNVRGLTR